MNNHQNRRDFFQSAAALSPSALVMPQRTLGFLADRTKVNLCGHLWVYASKYPPNWDCSPILEQVFSDMSYAGLYGIELMEVLLRSDNAVAQILAYSKKYNIKVSGSSYV